MGHGVTGCLSLQADSKFSIVVSNLVREVQAEEGTVDYIQEDGLSAQELDLMLQRTFSIFPSVSSRLRNRWAQSLS